MLYRLHQAIDRAAERDPRHVAARFSGDSLSYGQLAEGSSRLARVLQDRGVRKGDRVGIHAHKGLESALAIHGILKAGAAYVPLDPTAPPARLAMIARDCGIEHVVTEPSKLDAIRTLIGDGILLRTAVGVDAAELPDVGVPWSDVETAPAQLTRESGTELDLAYVLYTSGSTGAPKGVVHTHRSALSFAEAAAATYGLRSDDRITNHAPLHFDLSTLDYFATAVAGGTTVVIPESHTKLPASLAKLLADERVTVLYAVPLALAHLLLYGAMEQRDLTAIRWVLFGGEPFPPKHLYALMDRLPDAEFSNVYGPTEVNGVTYWVIPRDRGASDSAIPIGTPYPNVSLFVADPEGGAVAPGDSGELWVQSPTMMQGYWNRPALDERAFAWKPGPGPKGRTFHRTGDLVREDEAGLLHFLGRMDRQIKTRGYRVELDEVEAVLLTHPAVETAAAYGVPDGRGSLVIEASVVLRSDESVGPSDLKAHTALSLPGYAVPEVLDVVPDVPRTTTDKIDRVTLKKRAVERRTAKQEAAS